MLLADSASGLLFGSLLGFSSGITRTPSSRSMACFFIFRTAFSLSVFKITSR